MLNSPHTTAMRGLSADSGEPTEFLSLQESSPEHNVTLGGNFRLEVATSLAMSCPTVDLLRVEG